MKVTITDESVLKEVTEEMIEDYLQTHGWKLADIKSSRVWIARNGEHNAAYLHSNGSKRRPFRPQIEFLEQIERIEGRSQLAILADLLPGGRDRVLRLIESILPPAKEPQ